jgi:anaerobic dimethyl sulfoxide reductase subunit A
LDAAERGIADGDEVIVASPVGRARIPARVTDEIMPGVVCMLEGPWTRLDEDGIEIGGSPNALTSTDPTTPSQGTRTHSTWVEVAPAS